MQAAIRSIIESIATVPGRRAAQRTIADALHLLELWRAGTIAPTGQVGAGQVNAMRAEMKQLAADLDDPACRWPLDSALGIIANVRSGLMFGLLGLRGERPERERGRARLEQFWHLAEYRDVTAPDLTSTGRAGIAFRPIIREFPQPEPSPDDRARWVAWTQGRDWFPPLNAWLTTHPRESNG